MRNIILTVLLFLAFAGHAQVDSLSLLRKEKQEMRLKNNLKRKLDDARQIAYKARMVIYDFKTKRYVQSKIKPRIEDPIVYKIININRLAYDVKIESASVTITDDFFNETVGGAASPQTSVTVPAEPIAVKEIAKPIIGPEGIKKNSNAVESTTELETALKALSTSITDKKKDRETIVIALEKLQKEQLNYVETTDSNGANVPLAPAILLLKSANSLAIEEQKTALEDIDKEIQKLNKSKNEQEIAINIKKQQIKDAVDKSFQNLMDSYTSIVKMQYGLITIDKQYQDYRCLALNPVLDKKLYESKMKSDDSLPQRLKEYNQQVTDFEIAYAGFNNLFTKSMNEWGVFDYLEATAKENVRIKYQLVKDEADKIKAKIDDLDIPSKLRKVSAMHEVLRSDSGYEIASSPIQPLEDYVNFTVKVHHRDDKKQSEFDDDMEFSHREYARGGVRFDFSTGVAFDFQMDKNDKDDDDYFDNYILTDITVGGLPKKKIEGTSRSDFKPSLAGMFHTTFRSAGSVAFGLTLGFSLNVETFELNSIFPGVSLLIGRKPKFIITAGPSFRQMDILKKNYSINETYDPEVFGTDTDLTSKQFKVGLFVGLTYCLTANQRSKFKVGKD